MKKLFLAMPALALVFGPAIAGAADQPTAAQPAAPSAAAQPAPGQPFSTQPSNTVPPTATNPGSIPGSAATTPGATSMPEAAKAPADWKKLQGTVEAKDPTNNQLNIKDASGMVTQVQVNSNVVIRKEGKRVTISDVQTGDQIVLTNKAATTKQHS